MSELPLPSADTIARQKMLADTIDEKNQPISNAETNNESNSGNEQHS